MKRGIQGILAKTSTGTESYSAYFPKPLPPCINYPEIEKRQEAANKAIGELNGIMELIPDSDIINYFYVRKEAVLS